MEAQTVRAMFRRISKAEVRKLLGDLSEKSHTIVLIMRSTKEPTTKSLRSRILAAGEHLPTFYTLNI